MTRGNKEMMCDAENRQPVQYQYDKINRAILVFLDHFYECTAKRLQNKNSENPASRVNPKRRMEAYIYVKDKICN